MEYIFEHIGITVSNLEESISICKKYLGMEPGEIKDKPQFKLRLVSMKFGNIAIELLSPYSLNKRTEYKDDISSLLSEIGLNHIALSVDDIDGSYKENMGRGLEMVTSIMDSKCYFYKNSDGVLIEVRKRG